MDSAEALAETSSSHSRTTSEPILADLPFMLGSTISAAFHQP